MPFDPRLKKNLPFDLVIMDQLSIAVFFDDLIRRVVPFEIKKLESQQT